MDSLGTKIGQYMMAAINLYGVVDYATFGWFAAQYGMHRPAAWEIEESVVCFDETEQLFCLRDGLIISKVIEMAGATDVLQQMQKGRECFLPSKEMIERYFVPNYIPIPREFRQLVEFLKLQKVSGERAHKVAWFVLEASNCGHELEYLLLLSRGVLGEEIVSPGVLRRYVNTIICLRNQTRMVPLRGHTPAEIGEDTPVFQEIPEEVYDVKRLS